LANLAAGIAGANRNSPWRSIVRHGWEGVVLRLFRAKDFTFTVTGADQVTERYRRVHFTDGGLLEEIGVHPTM
jgi:hypothetical protein